jgi:hypothetical protein
MMTLKTFADPKLESGAFRALLHSDCTGHIRTGATSTSSRFRTPRFEDPFWFQAGQQHNFAALYRDAGTDTCAKTRHHRLKTAAIT